ncbi:MAG: carboxypeptidase M32 [Verrucomicrobia bacterium]|nr:carboxypeptidase M32 [Verrucomicrobiota bacterium]
MSSTAYLKLCERSREVYLLRSVAAVLSWDLETYIPSKAVPFRADQLSYLEAKAHALFTESSVGDWLQAAEQLGFDPGSEEGANIREWRRSYDRATKIPIALVEEFEKTRTIAREAWVQSRAESNFAFFKPHLGKIVELTRQKADLWGYQESPYDALIEDYEPGITARQVKPVLEEARGALLKLLGEIRNKSVPEKFLDGHYPIEGQQLFAREIATAFGYDFAAGRIDTTTHPFATSLGPFDQRITTRFDSKRFEVSLYGVMHETGHALYEQGLCPDRAGLPCGDAASLGIHESQSRLWENHVGRTLQFWQLWHATACRYLPDLARFSPADLASGLRRVTPSFIRVEADEVTYDLHILLRFELELALVEGRLKVEDLPEAWNARFYELFGLVVPDDAHGVLQDIHWSLGSLGYFPTYTLGNLNAAQLMAAAEKKVSGFSDELAQGNYAPLLKWLRENVHQHGRKYLPAELMRRATGESTQARYRVEYLRHKYLS